LMPKWRLKYRLKRSLYYFRTSRLIQFKDIVPPHLSGTASRGKTMATLRVSHRRRYPYGSRLDHRPAPAPAIVAGSRGAASETASSLCGSCVGLGDEVAARGGAGGRHGPAQPRASTETPSQASRGGDC